MPITLVTGRLMLREITLEDIPLIHQLHSIPEVDTFNTLGLPESILVTENQIKPILAAQLEVPQTKYFFFIQDDTTHFIGLAGINLGKPNYRMSEIWYKLNPAYWNKGYATEAVKRILNFCFNDLHLHRVTAGCATKNTASLRVLEKAGLMREAHHRKILPIRGDWIDNYEYAILEEDYFKLQQPTI